MNKQELIEKIENLPFSYLWDEPYLNKEVVLEAIKQLDEPEKVKIPQFVAEYIEQKKDDDYHLLGAMIEIRSHKNKEIDEWFEEDDNMELFARAWLDGYDAEKEPKYIVKLKNGQPLVKAPLGGKFYFNQNITAGNYKATRKELEEANFGWVFDCEGIEIEEVIK